MYIRCKKERISTPEKVVDIIRKIISKWNKEEQEKEHFFTIGMKNDNVIRYIDLTFIGSANYCVASPYEPLRTALIKGVTSLIIVHNHPCNATPSSLDNEVTRKFKEACKLLEIRFLDHIIVSPVDYYSYSDNGML